MSGLPDEDEEPYWGYSPDAERDRTGSAPPHKSLPTCSRRTSTIRFCSRCLRRRMPLPDWKLQSQQLRLPSPRAFAPEPPTARPQAGLPMSARGFIPNDLALRDSGLTGSYVAACKSGRLNAQLPSMAATGTVRQNLFYSEQYIAAALRFAQLWRRLAELQTWRPLGRCQRRARDSRRLSRGGTAHLQDSGYQDLACSVLGRHEVFPNSFRPGRSARDWMNTPRSI